MKQMKVGIVGTGLIASLMAKTFVAGIMYETVFAKENGYLETAEIAYKMAEILANGIVKKGFDLAYPFESNQIFVKIDDEDLEKWQEFASFEIMEKENGANIVRLVTSYRTKKEDVEGFLAKL